MNRLSLTFLAFLALATTSGGIAYQNAIAFIGTGNILNAIAFIVCAAVFGFAMLVLTRIVQVTARRRN